MDFNLSNFLPDETIDVESENKTNEPDKENISSTLEMLKPRSSRMSLLKSLDPLNPYGSPNISTDMLEKSKVKIEDSITTSKLNQSWNISLENDLVVNECNTQVDLIENDDLLFSFPQISLDPSSDSEILDESLKDENSVAVDNLVEFSPMKQFVSKTQLDKLKKLHRTQKHEWIVTEQSLRDEIARLQRDREDEIRTITATNEARFTQLVENHTSDMAAIENRHETALAELSRDRDSLMSDLLKENEDQLEIQRQDQAKLLESQRASIDSMKAELNQLRTEVEYLNGARLVDMTIIDQYSDTMGEMENKYRSEHEALLSDNRELEEMLNKCLTKVNLSKTVIANVQENNELLKVQLHDTEAQLRHEQTELVNKTAELDAAQSKRARDIDERAAETERQLKRKDVRVRMLENAETNLRAELELRTRERDQLQTSLMEMFQLH